MIVLSSGKKISPQDLEAYYVKSPYIEEVCIFLSAAEEKESKEKLAAAILPNYKQFRNQQITQIKDKIRWEVERVSRTLPPYKRIKDYILVSESLPKTILGKIKRYEVERMYISKNQGTKGSTRQLPQDDKLLSYPLCQKALGYLSGELKRNINLDDHLELDLGLDSLEQIGIFMEFQKITGLALNEEDFIAVFTVRDVLEKIKAVSSTQPKAKIATNWQEVLKMPFTKEIAGIAVKQSMLSRSINVFIVLVLKAIADLVFRLKVKNKTNLPRKKPFILCANHSSYLDGLLLSASLNLSMLLNVYFLGYAIYFRHPLIAWASKLLRLVAIDPTSNLIESLKTCSHILGKSKILCMFPEGVRSINGNIGEFKRGAGILIKELNVPAVPVYIEGTYQAWPPYQKLPKPGKVTIIFGRPIMPKELASKEKDAVDIYKDIVDNLRKEIIDLRNISEKK